VGRLLVRIAVCILTYNRPDGLVRVLASLRNLEIPSSVRGVTVVVVNNDRDDERPEAICAKAAEDLPHEVKYVVEPERGVAGARNRAIEVALPDHDLIAFIDDDGVATPDWLVQLMEVWEQTDADAVTGPVEPLYDEPPPAWIDRGGFFARKHRPTGRAMDRAFTNNVLIRSEFLRRTGIRFDPRFAFIGGDDAQFFRHFAQRGGSIVWANDAVVQDGVPVERTTASWLVRRHWRAGMTTAIIERDLHGRLVAIPLDAAKAVGWMLLGSGLFVVGLAGGRIVRVRGRCWFAWGRGLAEGLLGRSYDEYRVELLVRVGARSCRGSAGTLVRRVPGRTLV
jgi:glycosyltransferase involved in cell wall biosynthesis